LLELLFLVELLLLDPLFEPELELFFAPPDFEAALAIFLSLRRTRTFGALEQFR
jgi:hypothetical protein